MFVVSIHKADPQAKHSQWHAAEPGNLSLGRRSEARRAGWVARWALPHWGLGALGVPLALLCTGCPVGVELERPYQEYVSGDATPTATTMTAATTAGGGSGTPTATTAVTGTATTGPPNCTDAQFDLLLEMNCGSPLCHGSPTDPPNQPIPWILASRKMELMVPGVECPNEYIIDPNNPAASLLITTLKRTSACGVEMPAGLPLSADKIECVEGWVNDVVAAAAGVVTEPATGVGGGSAF